MKKIAYSGLLIFFVLILLLPHYTRAEDETAADFCQKFCIGEPDCCTRMRNSHDPFECEWPTRGWCKPEICSQIEGKGQRCGWYWLFHNANDNDYKLGTNSPNGYGCMIGDSEATMRPKCGPTPIPTSPPTPTAVPTSPPPPTSVPLPTSAPMPTNPPPIEVIPTDIPPPIEIPPTKYIPPVEPPTTVPTENPYQSQGFSIPLMQIPTIPMVCSSTTTRPDPISYVLDQITYYDHVIENTINIKFLLFYHMVRSKISPQP